MLKKLLVNKIYNLCFELEIYINSLYVNITKKNIGIILDEIEYVEHLYNSIFIRAKKRRILHKKRVKDVLILKMANNNSVPVFRKGAF